MYNSSHFLTSSIQASFKPNKTGYEEFKSKKLVSIFEPRSHNLETKIQNLSHELSKEKENTSFQKIDKTNLLNKKLKEENSENIPSSNDHFNNYLTSHTKNLFDKAHREYSQTNTQSKFEKILAVCKAYKADYNSIKKLKFEKYIQNEKNHTPLQENSLSQKESNFHQNYLNKSKIPLHLDMSKRTNKNFEKFSEQNTISEKDEPSIEETKKDDSNYSFPKRINNYMNQKIEKIEKHFSKLSRELNHIRVKDEHIKKRFKFKINEKNEKILTKSNITRQSMNEINHNDPKNSEQCLLLTNRKGEEIRLKNNKRIFNHHHFSQIRNPKKKYSMNYSMVVSNYHQLINSNLNVRIKKVIFNRILNTH